MIPGKHNFTINQGATFSRRLRVSNPDGTPYDFSGCTARMQIRRDVKDSGFYVELTIANGRITVDLEDGALNLYLSDEITKDIPRDGVYDLEIQNEYGEVSRLIYGNVRLIPEVTR